MSDMFVSNFIVNNLTLTLANTEYSQALNFGCSYFEVRCRSIADLKMAFVATESGTTFFSIPAGSTWYTKGKIPTTITIYLQSPSAGVVAEIISAR